MIININNIINVTYIIINNINIIHVNTIINIIMIYILILTTNIDCKYYLSINTIIYIYIKILLILLLIILLSL